MAAHTGRILSTCAIALLMATSGGSASEIQTRPARSLQGPPHGHHHPTHCRHCPRCHCELTVEREKLTRTCYEIECKPICIPKVTFPWQKQCEPKCAYVKMVRSFKPVEQELQCERCLYKWTPVCTEFDQGAGCCAGCPAASDVSGRGDERPEPDSTKWRMPIFLFK